METVAVEMSFDDMPFSFVLRILNTDRDMQGLPPCSTGELADLIGRTKVADLTVPKRARARKYKAHFPDEQWTDATPAAVTGEPEAETPKRKRGRPPKNAKPRPVEEPAEAAPEEQNEEKLY